MRRELRGGANREHGSGEGRLVVGVVVVVLGVLFLLDNLGIVRVENIWQFWPVILIVLGLARLTTCSSNAGRAGGLFRSHCARCLVAADVGRAGWTHPRDGAQRRRGASPGRRPNFPPADAPT